MCAVERVLFVGETWSGFGILIAHVDVYDKAGRFSGLADRLISLVPISTCGAKWRARFPSSQVGPGSTF